MRGILSAITRGFDDEAIARQNPRDENANAGIVINDQRAPFTSHGLLQKHKQSQQHR
jgi:hypothetical protein